MTLSVEQCINSEDSEMVVYGYRKCRWRKVLVYTASVLLAGIPFLVFHWYPRWLLFATCVRCCFQDADKVLVTETYQKKCKTHYIHEVLKKDIADTSGLLNEGFQDDKEEKKEMMENPDALHTPIRLDDGSNLNVQSFRFFMHKKQSLIWDPLRAQWGRLAGVERGITCAQVHAMAARAPSSEKRVRMLNIYGLNEIKVPIQTVFALVLLEVSSPFYVFQVFTIAVWIAENYYYYSVAIIIMSTFGIVTSVIQTKKNQESLRATVEAHDTVQLWDGRTVDSRAVAPGDVVLIPPRGCILHFDAALLAGSCVLNESMLTGESVPVSKSALQRVERPLDLKEHASSVLFCGTRVIQARNLPNEPVRALVLRTGYSTSKGELIRSILYPVPADFKFDRDSYKFIFILAIIAAVGLAYTIALKSYRSFDAGDVVLKALDIITIVIPPALPAAMTVGRLYAVTRLKRARVSCLNTRAVNVSGSLDCMCFDKTGTLTEDGMDMWGVVPVSAASVPRRLDRPQRHPASLNDLHDLKIGMATCHSLTLHEGVLAGDPLDLKMFESTGWSLEQPDASDPRYQLVTHTIVRPKKTANINVDDIHMPLEVGIVLQHQFVSSLTRASVVCKLLGEDVLRVYCKGAPETVAALSDPQTVPADLTEVLNSYAEQGYRVIALGSRVMEVTFKEVETMTREEVECNLEFLGLVIMENRLKAATTSVIRELKEADIHVVMITGDNVHTAVCVARECGILASGERVVTLSASGGDAHPVIYCESTLNGATIGRRTPLPKEWRGADSESWGSNPGDSERGAKLLYKIVMTGDVWRVLRAHYPAMVPAVAARGAVFARMSSDQKQQLVLEYQALGYYVGMCGDGANDCGALRAAHAGISLSELESSVAAPFTSADPDIVCAARVLREGRAALTTSFGVFKFMVGYSLTEFLSVAFLYYFDSNLTDFQFLFIDLGLIINFAFFFGLTRASTGKLCKDPPLTSLLGLVPLTSLVGQLVIVATAQFLSFYALTMFPWYTRHLYEGEESYECWENYAIFCVSMFQYIVMVLAFSRGAPYRRSVVTNVRLMASVVVTAVVCVYITLWPSEWLRNLLQLRLPKDILMSYIILALASFNLVLALFFEKVVVEYLMEEKKFIPRFVKEKRVRKTPHLTLKRQLTDMDYLDGESSVNFDREVTAPINSSQWR